MSSNHVTLLSLLLSIFAIGLSFYFWKNPISDETKSSLILQDNDVVYVIGKKRKEWIVNKMVTGNINKGEPYKYFANKKNNPTVKTPPKNLGGVKELVYDLDV